MSLLSRLGPLGIEKPTPLSDKEIQNKIIYVFKECNVPSNSGFCWADVIQSPGALRKQFTKIKGQPKNKTINLRLLKGEYE